MEPINICYEEIVDFYKKLGISTECDDTTPQDQEPPAGWEMPTAFDNTPLLFSSFTTNPPQGLG